MQIAARVEFFAAPEVRRRTVGEDGRCVRVIGIRDDVPLGGAGGSCLVAAPAYILPAEDSADILPAEDYGLRGEGVYQLFPCLVVVLLPALALGMGSVEPDFVYGAVLGQQLGSAARTAD